MKKIINTIKTRKLLLTLFITVIVFTLLGMLFPAIISKENQKLVHNSLYNFFLTISNGKLNYQNALFTSLTNNIILDGLIWSLGISIIGIPIIIFALMSRSFILGFSLTSVITTYGFKGVILAIIYIIPHIINLFITFIVSYYAVSFSLMLFNNLFRKKEYNRREIVKRYLKILAVSLIMLIFSSIIEVYVVPNILKLCI